MKINRLEASQITPECKIEVQVMPRLGLDGKPLPGSGKWRTIKKITIESSQK